jgi:hypothetical protein
MGVSPEPRPGAKSCVVLTPKSSSISWIEFEPSVVLAVEGHSIPDGSIERDGCSLAISCPASASSLTDAIAVTIGFSSRQS